MRKRRRVAYEFISDDTERNNSSISTLSYLHNLIYSQTWIWLPPFFISCLVTPPPPQIPTTAVVTTKAKRSTTPSSPVAESSTTPKREETTSTAETQTEQTSSDVTKITTELRSPGEDKLSDKSRDRSGTTVVIVYVVCTLLAVGALFVTAACFFRKRKRRWILSLFRKLQIGEDVVCKLLNIVFKLLKIVAL